MSLLQNWFPPSREHWELIVQCFQYFPLVTVVQWGGFEPWFGKTSMNSSKLNIPGKIGWATMECPGFINLLYIMFTLPKKLGIEKLPIGNWLLVGLFTLHYINRCFIGPYLSPAMAPIHVTVWACAFCWQLFNSTCIGGWLAGYGPTNDEFWGSRPMKMQIGLILFVLGLTGNFWHDEELREIRQAAMKKQKNHAEEKDKAKKSVEKVYVMPENGLFAYILYPHYVCEWIEWMGFWLIGGMSFLPGQMFVVNEITTMLPRAVQGKRWYLEKFGKEKVGRRGAVIPGLL